MSAEEKIVNSVTPGFLGKYRTGKGEGVEYIALDTGFLRLEYAGEDDYFILSRVSFTAAKSKHSPAIGEVLECRLSPDSGNDVVTFIGEMSVSGLQWAGGEVLWSHTYEDDSEYSGGRKIDLAAWFDECIAKMINPSAKILAAIKKGYNVRNDIDSIKRGNNSARERLWQKCSPSSAEESALVLELLDYALKNDDTDLIFSCCDPLKRASDGIDIILESVTSWLEQGLPGRNYDRSEMQEILAVHAAQGGAELAGRWMNLCRSSIEKKGVKALHMINEGSLFTSIASVEAPDEEVNDFIRSVVSLVEETPEEKREGVEELHVFSLMKKRISGG
ncbi:MAG TPA: hypothetical protein PK358_07155 [Spirochaetota bacterium]|nr:hypothetical protein [Spirochaetota bacterium]